MKQNSYQPDKTLKVFQSLGFKRITETENDLIYYLHHSMINKEIFVDKKDAVDFEFLEYQLDHIGIRCWIFDSLYESIT